MLSIFRQKDLSQAPQPAEVPIERPVAQEAHEAPVLPVQKNLKDDDIKQETISRLRKALGNFQLPQTASEPAGETNRTEAAPKVTPIDRLADTDDPAGSKVIPESAKVTENPPVVEMHTEGHDAAIDFEVSAEGFARSLVGALTGVVRQTQSLAVEDRKRLAAAVEELTRASRELATLASQVAALREEVQAQSQIVAALESVCVTLPAAHQTIEKRLDAQASAIRSIHAAVQEREDRFNRFLMTLQPAAAAPASSGVPDNL